MTRRHSERRPPGALSVTLPEPAPHLTRSCAECELCERMLPSSRAAHACAMPAVELVDVDSDPLLARRWGLQVPVLLLDGTRVCGPRA